MSSADLGGLYVGGGMREQLAIALPVDRARKKDARVRFRSNAGNVLARVRRVADDYQRCRARDIAVGGNDGVGVVLRLQAGNVARISRA